MADYKRMVSYMYQYEDGVKKKNVGYAKIEAKSGQCKLTLHMQLLGQLDSIFPTYLIQRDHNNMELIYLGDAFLKNQVMDSKFTTEESNVMNTGLSLSSMGGLLLFLNDRIFFATEWDDKPIVAVEVLNALKPKPKKTTAPREMTIRKEKEDLPKTAAADFEVQKKLTLAEELSIPKYKLPRGWKTVERLQKPGINDLGSQKKTVEAADIEVVKEVEPKVVQPVTSFKSRYTVHEVIYANKPSTVKETVKPDIEIPKAVDDNIDTLNLKNNSTDNTTLEDPQLDATLFEEIHPEASTIEDDQAMDTVVEEVGMPLQEDNFRAAGLEEEQPDPPSAKRFFDNYPRIYPFEDNEITICVKIEPKDIGLFPKNIWTFSNNSFLMHGYYCYHHLIFAKMSNQYGCQYILGIPGIYHEREKFMARMFGFESFKSIKKRDLRQGDFGYWYLPICF